MSVTTLDDGRLVLEFTIERDGYVYSDAIVGESDYINSLSDEEIETIKKDRFDRWFTIVTVPQE